jgi:CSLREA domain-containing protein
MTRKFVLIVALIGLTLMVLPSNLFFKAGASIHEPRPWDATRGRALSTRRRGPAANDRGEFFAATSAGFNRNALTELFIPAGVARGRRALMSASGLSTFVVNNTGDNSDSNPGDGVCSDGLGGCSLRAAIQEANATAGADTIEFAIDVSGVATIAPSAPLPSVTDTLLINGYAQPGASPNSLPAGNNAVLLIELSGANLGPASGLTITAGDSAVQGLIINRFAGDGIVLSGAGNNSVQGNFIGTDSTGGVDLGNGASGIRIQGASAGNNIGGSSPDARNVISGNNGDGVLITGAGSDGNFVANNYVGTNAAGTAPLGNSGNGIAVTSSIENLVDGNIISGNGQNGISISGGGTDNQVVNNSIGTNPSATALLGNGANGVSVSGSSGNSIGLGEIAGPNTIAFNIGSGVLVASGTANVIFSNSIFSNGALGIDLNPPGATPNDACDGDAGANNLQNFPVLTSATSGTTTTLIQGALNSTANAAFRIDFFANTSCDQSGFGEGQKFIGSTNVTTSASCSAVINVALPTLVANGSAITATATDSAGNTSEFSQCVVVGGGPVSGCVLTCPADITAGVGISQCGAIVNYPPPATSGSCFGIICSPAAGSFFPLGTTTVTCSEFAVPAFSTPAAVGSCSFRVTVIDNIAPQITCPANISVTPARGQRSAVVTYPAPVVTDNCKDTFGTDCAPPSGASFPIGTTTVTCVAIDAGGNSSSCSFTVSVADTQAPTITCPGNVVVEGTGDQCASVVSFPAPNITGSPAGTGVTCAPPSGATFPAGTTAITCTATTPAGATATCGFNVTVNGPPRARVMLESNKPALDFGPTEPLRKSKKKAPKGCDCSETFMIENTGCGVLGLDLASIMRTGDDVDSGRITDPDDSKFFSVTIVNPDGTERPATCDAGTSQCIRINAGQKLTFRVVFKPLIPAAFSGRTRGLAASEVVPERITSKITFNQAGGGPLVINMVGRVSTPIRLIDPENPRGTRRVLLDRSGDEFTVTYAVFDSNLDADRTRFEFFDSRDRLVGQAIEVDLAGPIRQGNLVRGQSFVVVQRFTGARDNPEVASVRVTVFDPESSDTATGALSSSSRAASIESQSARRGVVLFPPRARFAASSR